MKKRKKEKEKIPQILYYASCEKRKEPRQNMPQLPFLMSSNDKFYTRLKKKTTIRNKIMIVPGQLSWF